MLKVGQLARRTGLTVRTLHHYEEVGLLMPSERTESGHRLYGAADVERLQRIVSLRQLGLSLEEIGACLNQPAFALGEVVRLHIERLREQIERGQRLKLRLEAMAVHLAANEAVLLDDLIQTIEVMTMYEAYYTPEQAEQIRRRAEELGREGMEQAQRDWAQLIEEVKAEMERGTDPSDARVQALLNRSEVLIAGFTGGDPGIRASLNRMYEELGPEQASGGAFDATLWTYLDRARAAKGDGSSHSG